MSGADPTPPGSPAPRRAAQSPVPGTPATPGAATPGQAGMTPGGHSVLSQSPVFARTPRSSISGSPGAGGAPGSPAPTLGPHTPGSASGTRTPVRAPRLGGVASPGGSPGAQGSPASGGSGRQPYRGFLGSPPKTPRLGVGLGPEEENYIYGTNINEVTVVKDFHRFICEFRAPGAAATDRPFYVQELLRRWENEMHRAKGIKFPISGSHIREFSEKLYTDLVNFPTEAIPIFDRELWNLSLRQLNEEPEALGTCQVQVHDLEDQEFKVMRNMNPSDIERLISIKGIVIRCSDLVPDMLVALFRCTAEDCKHEVSVALNHWTIDEPTKCESCGASHSFQIVHNECTFADRQVLKLQETPEGVPEGETPQNVPISCFDDLVDQVRPGDRVTVTGIYKATAVQPIAGWRTCAAVYRTFVDAVSIVAERAGRVDATPDEDRNAVAWPPAKLAEELDLKSDSNTEEAIAMHRKIRELAKEVDFEGKPTIAQRLVKSFAPSIYEEDDVKKGLLVQLFGGTAKPQGPGGGRCRPEINTLICGDPSTAKSQLLQYSNKLAPRGIFTSGKGSSAVGLTATINRDPVTKEFVLESGALVLSDRGLCCIDEFDKMDENARAILHEAMEQQTVSVAKAGIVCSLNARTSILASANPRDSAYDPRKSVVDNINLPKNLMTRFDFIWLMLDKRNPDLDQNLANFLVSMYSVNGPAARLDPPIDNETFTRYVSFAKLRVHPLLTDESAERLSAVYIDLRNQGSSREVVTATPRVLESLIRISEALAKMELREVVTVADVEEAKRLLMAATYAAAIDPETGLIDMEQLITSVGAGRRKRQKDVDNLLEEVLAERGRDGMMTLDAVKSAMNEKLGERRENLVTEAEFNQCLRTAEQDGRIRRQGKTVELR